jgi:hypothetical protein
MVQGYEKRRHPRTEISAVAVLVASARGGYLTNAQDISGGGARLSLPLPWNASIQAPFRLFFIFDEDTVVDVRAIWRFSSMPVSRRKSISCCTKRASSCNPPDRCSNGLDASDNGGQKAPLKPAASAETSSKQPPPSGRKRPDGSSAGSRPDS